MRKSQFSGELFQIRKSVMPGYYSVRLMDDREVGIVIKRGDRDYKFSVWPPGSGLTGSRATLREAAAMVYENADKESAERESQ